MRWLLPILLLLGAPVHAQEDPSDEVIVALRVSGYGPILPSEWREHVLPAARRSLSRLHRHWRLLSAAEVERLETEADRRAAADRSVRFTDVLEERYGGAHSFTLDASCGDDECQVRGVSDLDDGAYWTFPRTLSVRGWARALADAPENVRVGVGRGVGGRDFSVRESLGDWTDESRSAAATRVGELSWPDGCRPERTTVVDLVVEVEGDGSVGEIGASGGSRFMRRCLERALAGSIPSGAFERARAPRRLLLLGVGRAG